MDNPHPVTHPFLWPLFFSAGTPLPPEGVGFELFKKVIFESPGGTQKRAQRGPMNNVYKI